MSSEVEESVFFRDRAEGDAEGCSPYFCDSFDTDTAVALSFGMVEHG